METKKIEHIGIAVKNLDESVKYYQDAFGLKCYLIEEVKEQNVRTAFFNVGGTKIELLESTTPDGPIGKFIEKKGEGVHHIAFAVNNIDSSLTELSNKGIQLIDKQSKKGAEGLDVAFLHPKASFGVLIELCEKNNQK